jgi:hypothetical protein
MRGLREEVVFRPDPKLAAGEVNTYSKTGKILPAAESTALWE